MSRFLSILRDRLNLWCRIVDVSTPFSVRRKVYQNEGVQI